MNFMNTLFDKLLGEPPQGLLFDLDGTLIDSVPDIASAIDAMLDTLGYAKAGEAKVRRWVGNGAKKLVERALQHVLDDEIEGLSATRLSFAYDCFLTNYQEVNARGSTLYPGVMEFLGYCQQQRIPMAVVTNKPIEFVPTLLTHLDIEKFFAVVIGGECVEMKKPDPEMLLVACQRLNVSPDDSVMVGDSRNDIVAAQRAGMPVVAVNYGYNYDRDIALDGPDWIVGDLRELLSH